MLYETRAEPALARRAIWLSDRRSHGVPEKVLEGASSHYHRLSAVQRTVIERVAKAGRIAAVRRRRQDHHDEGCARGLGTRR